MSRFIEGVLCGILMSFIGFPTIINKIVEFIGLIKTTISG